ncbi:electron transport complex subunit RsxC [Aliikangiella maris]|uniref:Electron transport complex subunit RsxC n=2 Tax=Aliikangiella maris TaxID=3162458 RepID=A0ABV3MIM4_9GAMM
MSHTEEKTNIIFNEFTKRAPGEFHGGIHPEEYKTISNQSAIEKIKLPDRLILPIKQSIGNPGQILVAVNEQVAEGQLLIEHGNGIGAHIHAPATGIVKSIGQFYLGHPSGLPQTAIELKIRPDQSDSSIQFTPLDWKHASAILLRQRIEDAGIVGLGGATFPTHIKLSANPIETLIVNAMECEPYITCDDRLMQEHAEKIIIGALISARILAAQSIVIAIEDNKPEAIAALQHAILDAKNFNTTQISLEICVAPTKYPSGGEKQTIELVTGKQVPKGKLPATLGLVVQNIATLYAIYQAVIQGLPLVRRLVTITGSLISRPGNYWIPFGTTIDELIEQFEIDRSSLSRIIMGGPLMGQSFYRFDLPVSKSTNCLIFNHDSPNTQRWLTESIPHQECIRCSECEKVCPVNLLPQQLYWFSQSDQWDNLQNQGLSDCIECGACAYVCPSEIPLVQYYRYAKSVIQHNEQKQIASDKAKQRFEFREMRLARAKAERANKHAKAAEARKKVTLNDDSLDNKKAAINEALARVKKKKSVQQTSESQSDNLTEK